MAHWYEGQLRILQTVLREPDIQGYDAKAVVAYMKKTRSNVLVVNAGGIVDFFHNDVESAHLNPFMQDGQEILADLCDALHGEGFRIITRVDFRGVQEYRHEAHPDWFGRLSDGSPKRNWLGQYAPCYMSYYANEHAVEYITRLMERFPIDGVWENSVTFGGGICYCERCRESYFAETGEELPQEGEGMPHGGELGGEKSSAFQKYRAWRKARAEDHIKLLRSAVKKFGEDKAYVAEVFGMYHASASLSSGIDTYAAEHFDFTVGVGFLTGAPHGRPYDDLPYASSAVRFLKAIEPNKTTVLLTGNNGTKWRLVKDPSLETRLWMWEAVAAGANLWNCMFNGMHPDAAEDRRNAYIETDAYRYLEENQEILQGLMPVREAAILFSKPTRDLFGRDNEAEDRYGVGVRGLEKVLGDAHIPYGFITERDLSRSARGDSGLGSSVLDGVKVLCLPNCACLSDEHTEAIREYVRGGGALMASFETSLYDEDGNKRGDFSLKDVFGVSSTGAIKDTSQDCYQMVRLPEHPLLDGMDAGKTRFLINGGETLLVAPCGEGGGSGDSGETGGYEKSGGETVAAYVPIIPNQYPEQAWIRDEHTDFPTVYCHSYGKGRVVYFANTMEACVYRNGHEDFWDLTRNALNFLRGGAWSLETDAPCTTRIHLLQKSRRGNPHGGENPHSTENPHGGTETSYVLSCVNHLTNRERAARFLHPADAFTAILRLPGSHARVAPLYSETSDGIRLVKQTATDGTLEIELFVPAFKEFISAHIAVE